jgi:D-beta-D-heptose 7-phosphate kinase/D-beta-D-heptose 1-phosphate adenosyltransferase
MASVYIPHVEPRIALFGDIMLDYNIEGNSYKIANEGPVPIIHANNEQYNIGGCGNVLMNLFALGSKDVFLFSRIGKDDHGSRLTMLLPPHTHNCMIYDPSLPTITKHRIYSDKKLVARYDVEQIQSITHEQEEQIVEQFATLVTTSGLTSVIFSDYNKGFLTKSLCQRIIQLCIDAGIPTIVDPKIDYTKYIGCTVIKPNRAETKRIFKLDVDSLPLHACHTALHELVRCTCSVITLSGDGISAYEDGKDYRISETTKDVIDVTGAGDIVCAVLGAYYPYIHNRQHLISIANHLASISVSHLGVYHITEHDLIQTYQFVHETKQISMDIVAKLQHKLIVFTNGCFDILHSAHIELFRFCKSLGGTVIVGLNSDESIKRLKGPHRPIYTLEDRIKILNAISYIDYIIPFEEDTPLELIRHIRPTYLVKGGDYTKENVVGKEYANEVVIFDYIPNRSTTAAIRKMHNVSEGSE